MIASFESYETYQHLPSDNKYTNNYIRSLIAFSHIWYFIRCTSLTQSRVKILRSFHKWRRLENLHIGTDDRKTQLPIILTCKYRKKTEKSVLFSETEKRLIRWRWGFYLNIRPKRGENMLGWQHAHSNHHFTLCQLGLFWKEGFFLLICFSLEFYLVSIV